jgi:DNA-3-methyladenine glycosylase I
MTNEHQAPWDCVYAKENDSTCQPGQKPASDREYFEILCLCLLQAGLNWNSIRKHWQRYKAGFSDFDIDRLAESPAAELMENPNVIKNSRKIEAIIHNAGEFREIEKEYGSFAGYLETLKAQTEKEQLKSLSKRFKQVGPETADYFLHSIGFWT